MSKKVCLRRVRVLLLPGLVGIIPSLFLFVFRLSTERHWTWFGFLPYWWLTIVVLTLASLTKPMLAQDTKWRWSGPIWLCALAALSLVLILTKSAVIGVILICVWWIIVLHLYDLLHNSKTWYRRWAWLAILAVSAGAWPAALTQLESQFADEEFFVALEIVHLTAFWLLLLIAYRLISKKVRYHISLGTYFDKRAVSLVFLFTAYSNALLTYNYYRYSFYPEHAPVYPGISRSNPFICGKTHQIDQTYYSGRDIFNRIVARVEINPNKGTPEYGMLAIATGKYYWAQKFREAILQEALEGRYTTPSQSIKAGQYRAALRVYYYLRVHARFPNLFSEQDDAQIRKWFSEINRRALTPEWVDFLYALAFSKWPEGPYENQESGAGLLALLELSELADVSLSPLNRAYLNRNPRGWLERFRVTDDAVIYHPEWIYNAYFQYLYTEKLNKENARLAFDWLLLQALPDGAPLRYNHPTRRSWAGIAYLGAQLLGDPRYLWLAGRAVEYLERSGDYLFAPIGVEAPVTIDGYAPDVGSCLLYGDSGLPNQRGPLAPDKIILRDGWRHDSLYLLVNLRFTGWHRYKATGTLSLMYRNEPLMAEVLEGEPFKWLPAGRRLFRDKRIPRENLNGLVVEKTGLSAAIYWLTGLGGAWAQDPPHYAEIIDFRTTENWDHAHIRLSNWRGWRHDRLITIQHADKPRVIITDTAQGPGRAGLVWHLMHAETSARGFKIGSVDPAMNVQFFPLDGKANLDIRPTVATTSGLSVIYQGVSRLHLVTIFEGEPQLKPSSP